MKWICARRVMLSVSILILAAMPALWLGCGAPRHHPPSEHDGRLPGFAHRPPGLPSGRPDPRTTMPPPRPYRREQALPALTDEVWVIARDPGPPRRPEPTDPAEAARPVPTAPMLARIDESRDEPVALPLKHTEAHADITGHVATVHLKQRYHNPYDGRIEAVYVFPLPEHAAVNGFTMTIGARRIHGIIRPREQAEQIYYEARTRGHRAAMLTEHRPNVFTQRVANIAPREQIDIQVRYFHTLRYEDGDFEFVFPMVVGPRHNPPGTTDGIAAAPAGTTAPSPQPARLTYLGPDQRSGHDIDLHVDIDAGLPIDRIECHTHRVHVDRPRSGRATVRLAGDDRIPNRDFVLRFRPAGEDVRAMMFAQPPRADAVERGDDEWGYFSLMLLPPDDTADLPRRPMHWTFLIDASATMNGEPLEAAKTAVVAALHQLDERDTFQIVRFGGRIEQFRPEPIRARNTNVLHAHLWVQRLSAGGGVDMVAAIEAALDVDGHRHTAAAARRRDEHAAGRGRVVAILTDGLVGNEAAVLTALHEHLGEARVFSFGIGSAPNRFLIERMARLGRGAVAYVSEARRAEQAMSTFIDRASRPALTDLQLDFGDLPVRQITPQALPELYAGRPVIVSGRFRGGGVEPPASITLTARRDGQSVRIDTPVRWRTDAGRRPGLDAAWARHRIADAHDRALIEGRPVDAQLIETLAMDHALVSAWTAMVAVDGSGRPTGRYGTTLEVPVPMPAGVCYEITDPPRK